MEVFGSHLRFGSQTLARHPEIDGVDPELAKPLEEPAHPLLRSRERVAATFVTRLGIVHDKAAAVLIRPLGGFLVNKLF